MKTLKEDILYHEIYLSSGSLLEMKTMLHISKKMDSKHKPNII